MDHRHFDEDHVPGTIKLVDLAGNAFSQQHDANHKDIVLIPRPNADPEDPLNWTWNRKILAVSMAYLYYGLFKALPGRPSSLNMLRMVYRPVIMVVRFPTVAWAGFLYGINLAWYNVLNGTASPVLTAAPYNFSAAGILDTASSK